MRRTKRMTAMNKEIQIVMADDHPIVRQGLRQTIEADAALKTIREGVDGLVALIRGVEGYRETTAGATEAVGATEAATHA